MDTENATIAHSEIYNVRLTKDDLGGCPNNTICS